jgi:hypothetical protein
VVKEVPIQKKLNYEAKLTALMAGTTSRYTDPISTIWSSPRVVSDEHQASLGEVFQPLTSLTYHLIDVGSSKLRKPNDLMGLGLL